MRPFPIRNIASLLISATVSVAAMACVAPEEEATTVEIPLSYTTPDGDVYRLGGASFEITGPVNQTISADGDEPSIGVALPPGLYNVRLTDGWILERSTAGGPFQAVQALLGSQNPQAVRVFADSRAFLTFTFFVRDPNGTLTINFDVIAHPRQIVGFVRVLEATGDFAGYAPNQVIDYSTYFEPYSQLTATAPDGSQSRNYEAFPVAIEFFNDPIGLLSGPVARELTGGYLEYHVRTLPDAQLEASGSYQSQIADTTLTLQPGVVFGTLDADGFPADAFFVGNIPFELTRTGTGTEPSVLRGRIRVRHLLQ